MVMTEPESQSQRAVYTPNAKRAEVVLLAGLLPLFLPLLPLLFLLVFGGLSLSVSLALAT